MCALPGTVSNGKCRKALNSSPEIGIDAGEHVLHRGTHALSDHSRIRSGLLDITVVA